MNAAASQRLLTANRLLKRAQKLAEQSICKLELANKRIAELEADNEELLRLLEQKQETKPPAKRRSKKG